MNDTGFFGWYKCWYFAKWDFCKLPIYSNLRTEFDSTPRTISLDFQSLTLSVARGLIVLVSMEIFLLNRWNLLISHISPLISVDFAYIPADQVQRAVGLLRIPDRFLRQEHVVGPAVHNTSRGLVRTGILISRGGGKFARFNRVFLIRFLPL